MKIGLLCFLSVMLSAQLLGQTVSIQEKRISLPELFKEIRRQTGFEFLYNSQMIEDISPFEVNVKNETVPEVLNGCFKNLPLTYKIMDDKTIIVRQKTIIKKQDTTVTPVKKFVQGKILDQDGHPVSGASIYYKNTTHGMISDYSGKFKLEVSNPSEDSIVISFIGYQERTV
ncbi:MAG TPA: carboxypeptidase-like regulatory domain-containing protein, partial [Hanamia sp.]|nr:carboxypeptidase-like regulatory domain-containing protein [Hanamia sp.]